MTLIHGECLEELKKLPENSVDAIVTDPPYGLSFMGKKWDYDVPSVEIWQECLRVLKPGGYLLSFAGTRTYHRMATGIEDAGFEIRDMIAWVYGSGFPKSLNIGKAVDKLQGNEREAVRDRTGAMNNADNSEAQSFTKGDVGFKTHFTETKGTSPWEGWGTALKPSHEDITVARKPLYSSGDCAIMAQKIIANICQLPSVARIVEKTLASSQNELGGGAGIARWIVGDSTSTPAVLSDLTAMLRSESEKNSSLNTELSWLNTLADLLKNESMFTTETKTSLIIDLKILNSLLSKITQSTTTKDETKPNGEDTNASLVEHTFSVFGLKLKTIQEHFVGESAISRAGEQDLRPSLEPITVARKPLIGTVAENCLKWGVGGINIDECRIKSNEELGRNNNARTKGTSYVVQKETMRIDNSNGKRFPANLIHDGSEEVVELFPNDSQRFFYVAKASKSERNMGCEELEATRHADRKKEDGSGGDNPRNRTNTPKQNFHPTVKPIALMEYIVRLVSREGATVLDPFMGSGTTGIACKKLKRHFIGIEKEAEYIKIAESRISAQPITLL